ncbi:hypothetical protein H9Q13_06630 [Pontibacter sp. JH31]|uniref:Imelysin n=1 Tax=Pontibacter aquaedesilientis TaxID=2766980 RepID=A0ABR7XEX2_9BACT|nr:hypothetical protein [Pontibacter aquaedesilientis]MBD1396834.1 hypothetical protein [Pontibacter aquaedesilientis]
MKNFSIAFTLCLSLSVLGACSPAAQTEAPTSTPKAVSLSQDCEDGINTFNQQLTQRYIRDIARVSSSNASTREELRTYYPEAREAWNSVSFPVF